MPLELKFSNSLSALGEILADVDQSGRDPFEKGYIIVASTGLRRWLSQRIASHRGIHANCEFPTPRTFIHLLLEQVLGRQESERFSKEAMTWQVYEALRKEDAPEELGTPIQYIRNNWDNRDMATLQLAEKVADLFDQYLTYRPDWILSWEQGEPIRSINADTANFRKHESWQACLWRMLADGREDHRAHLYEALLQALHEKRVAGLPEHLSIFGTHTLPPVFLKILLALGNHHAVSIYLTQPTPEFWGDHPLKSLGRGSRRFLTETCQDGLEEDWGNPLIASMGGQGRDLFNLLIDENIATREEDDMRLFQVPGNATVMGAVQRSVYEMTESVDAITDHPELDDSLRFHCCHHPLREVEVLHDTLLNWFKKDPDLSPSDVMVLAPDIEIYAPFIDSVFGQSESGLPEIPFSIADRVFREKSRVVNGFFKILEVCQSRFTAVDMFALFQSPVFRRRFGWDEDDLSTIRQWLSDTGTAWGMDQHHRAGFDIPAFNDYSWDATMEKIFLGYALPRQPECTGQETQAYDQVEGQDAILIGKLAEAIRLLKDAASALASPKSPAAWAEVIETKIVKAFLDNNLEETLEVRQIREGLNQLEKAAKTISIPIRFEALAVYLESLIEDGITARGFLSRGVSFGSLQPMRAIPRKVICMLGMETGAFPTDPRPLGFNLMRHKGMPRPGDRANNQSGRYLFLETILSAADKLHISFSGFSTRDDSFSPPATPVGELLDFLHKTWPVRDEDLLKSPFLISHRLHGHHSDYFNKSAIGLFSYVKSNYVAAEASLQPKNFNRHERLDKAQIPETVTTAELAEYFVNPAKYFLRKQLGIELPYTEKELLKSEPLELDSLASYTIRESRVFERIGWPTRALSLHVPPGTYGKWCLEKIEADADNLFEELNKQVGFENLGNPQTISTQLTIDLDSHSLLLSGEADRIYEDTRILFRPSESKPKDLIWAWITHLALNADSTGMHTDIYSGKATVRKAKFEPIEKSRAIQLLREMMSHYLSGQASPLPWILECSFAFAESRFKGGDDDTAMTQAMKAWLPKSWSSSSPPSADPWNALCWGNRPPFLAPYTESFIEAATAIATPMMEHMQ